MARDGHAGTILEWVGCTDAEYTSALEAELSAKAN
jgi:hypothetical protein